MSQTPPSVSSNAPTVLSLTPISGGCGCCTPAPENTTTNHTEENTMSETTTTTYPVTGMTCGHCASAVTSEVQQLPGVTDVKVDLVAGGTSQVTVTSADTLTVEQVTGALDEAGDYHLAATN